eukprot:Phypoly_transcript_17482.p1 GENE.Phypoly_transcript_17482~~Phypoly_transcript_17482.p1  ORF type:complete len:190 (+),score=11.35 Phypoly_transcript_17482:68-571(+)
MDQTYENMFPNAILCPREGQLLNQVNSEPEYISYMKSLLPLQQKLSQVLGIPLAQVPDWPELFDAFQVMTCYNQSYPGLDDDTIEQIFATANWQWNYQLNNSELAILQTKDVMQYMKQSGTLRTKPPFGYKIEVNSDNKRIVVRNKQEQKVIQFYKRCCANLAYNHN